MKPNYRLMKKVILFLLVTATFACLTSCKSEKLLLSVTPPPPSGDSPVPNEISAEDPSPPSDNTSLPDAVSATEANMHIDPDNLAFSYLFDYIFCFSSGMGAWRTMVHINADGTFDGYYLDSDAGSQYVCIFNGKFSSLIKTGEYEYSMTCETLNTQHEVGTQAVVNGIPTTYTSPYGFDDANVFKLYLPGKSLDELPLEFKQWVYLPWTDPEEGEYYINSDYGNILAAYGLYNEDGKQGFSTW